MRYAAIRQVAIQPALQASLHQDTPTAQVNDIAYQPLLAIAQIASQNC